jgi:methionine-rich copper-binding protein CopC
MFSVNPLQNDSETKIFDRINRMNGILEEMTSGPPEEFAIMKRSLIIATALFGLAVDVSAHTHLQSSTPADKSVVTSAPSQITLNFSEPTRLTALSIQKESAKEKHDVESLPKDASKAITVPVDALSPGKYAVSWRAVGKDSHVMSGTFGFTVSGK